MSPARQYAYSTDNAEAVAAFRATRAALENYLPRLRAAVAELGGVKNPLVRNGIWGSRDKLVALEPDGSGVIPNGWRIVRGRGCVVSLTVANTYWDAVREHLKDDNLYGGVCVDWTGRKPRPNRHELVSRYSWTVTDPTSVDFVRQHAGPRLLDPMAGSGWWCRLLADAGVDVLAIDAAPPHHGGNHYHKAGISHVLVNAGDAVDAAAREGAGRTLLLSWPPYDEPLGAKVLAAYPGDRVIYIGEGEGGCCGDDAMHSALDSEWTKVAEHRPVQWWGIHDYIRVFDRRTTEGGPR